MKAVPRITLAPSLGRIEIQTFLRSCLICSSVVTTSTASRGELSAVRRCTTSTRSFHGEQAITAKLCVIRFGHAPARKMANVDVHLPLSPSDTITLYFCVVSRQCDSTISWAFCLSCATFVFTNAVHTVSSPFSSWMLGFGEFTLPDSPRWSSHWFSRSGRVDFTEPKWRHRIFDVGHTTRVAGLGSDTFFCETCCCAS